MPIKTIIAVRVKHKENTFAHVFTEPSTATDGVQATHSEFPTFDRMIFDGEIVVKIYRETRNEFNDREIVLSKENLTVTEAINAIKGGTIVKNWKRSTAQKKLILDGGVLMVIQ